MKIEMFIKTQRKTFNNRFLNTIENSRMIFGFTEKSFSLPDLASYLHDVPVLQLKQIHSDTILLSDKIKSGASGDGIILNQRNRLALIKTADCIPLTFWETTSMLGGIIHVGWRGLHQKIESKLLQILDEIRIDKENLKFYIGPSIESKCYPVGPEIYELFNGYAFRDKVFQRKNRVEFHLDLKNALTLSLISSGIKPDQIFDSNICNFCESERFPSYRRGDRSGKRIYNFLLFR
jgi:YfiH family protein